MKLYRLLLPLGIAGLMLGMLALGVGAVQAAPGSGPVTNCTDVGVTAALSGGGLVTFNCGGPATITLTLKTITATTFIDGSNNGQPLTLTASGTQIFVINSGVILTLSQVTVANLNGASYAYPIVNNGRIELTGTLVYSSNYLINNLTAASAARLINSQFVSTTNVLVNTSGPLTVTNSQFLQNAPSSSYGMFAIYGGAVSIDQGSFISNTSVIALLNTGALTITNSLFQGNNTGGSHLIYSYATEAVDNTDFISNSVGSLLYSKGRLTVSNSRFIQNRGGSYASSINMDGWAAAPALTVTNSSFMSNTAPGGAIYNYYGGTAYITNTAFYSNTSLNSAGAVYLDYPGQVQILSSTFSLGMGGGIYVNGGTNPLIVADSQFVSNTSGGSAGAIDAGTLTVTHSSFISNTSGGGSGAIDSNRQVYLADSTFLSNTGYWGGAMELSSGGGGPFYDVVTNCVIQNNTSTSQGGGGIRATQHLTLINSDVSSNTVMGNSSGGGVYFANGYILTITNTLLRNNVVTGTTGSGGGVYVWGTSALISNSVVVSNAAGAGGGIYQSNAPLLLVHTPVLSNTATWGHGGGLYAGNVMTLAEIEVSGNRTLGGNGQGFGAGLYDNSYVYPLQINHSLFFNNRASLANSQGGGLYLNNPTAIVNTTLYSNSAGSGTGLYNFSNYQVGLTNTTLLSNTSPAGVITSQVNNNGLALQLTLANTLVGGSTGGNCVGLKILSRGHNLSSDASCAITTTGDLSSTDPLLGVFQDNGGPTFSFLPQPASPAVNAGDNNLCPGDDQRGTARPLALTCDIGAIESPYLTSQMINFGALPDRLITDPSFSLSATASSGLTVTFSSAGVCNVAGTLVTLSGVAGSCTLTATQSGDAGYAPAVDVARTFTVTQLTQTINFSTLADKLLGDLPFAISATASSGLTPTFTSQTTGVCTVSVNQVTLVGGGQCTLRAAQAGDATYAAAPMVDRSFTVFLTQTITFDPLPDRLISAAAFPVTPTASSGLPVTVASLTPAFCTVNGAQVTLLAVGTCTLRASQSGNGSYAAAAGVDRSFAVKAFTLLLPVVLR